MTMFFVYEAELLKLIYLTRYLTENILGNVLFWMKPRNGRLTRINCIKINYFIFLLKLVISLLENSAFWS